MLFIKTDNKGLVLLGLIACCLFALGQASDNTPDAKNAIPLRTHSLYMPYIGIAQIFPQCDKAV